MACSERPLDRRSSHQHLDGSVADGDAPTENQLGVNAPGTVGDWVRDEVQAGL
jgi:hypothetical protein